MVVGTAGNGVEVVVTVEVGEKAPTRGANNKEEREGLVVNKDDEEADTARTGGAEDSTGVTSGRSSSSSGDNARERRKVSPEKRGNAEVSRISRSGEVGGEEEASTLLRMGGFNSPSYDPRFAPRGGRGALERGTPAKRSQKLHKKSNDNNRAILKRPGTEQKFLTAGNRYVYGWRGVMLPSTVSPHSMSISTTKENAAPQCLAKQTHGSTMTPIKDHAMGDKGIRWKEQG